YNLLRNELTFCNAPEMTSAACTLCVFGDERRDHMRRIRVFFDKFNVEIAAPSKNALHLWQRASSLPYRKATAVPHFGNKSNHRPSSNGVCPTDGPIRIAFLGHPANHKGWSTFAHLASEPKTNGLCRFFHLGETNTRHPKVQFSKVRSSVSNPNAMIDAIA